VCWICVYGGPDAARYFEKEKHERYPGLEQVKSYFGKRMEEYGAFRAAWIGNSDESRTRALINCFKIVENPSFSIRSIGCGYGLGGLHGRKGFHAGYYGFDILESAINVAAANKCWQAGCIFLTDGIHCRLRLRGCQRRLQCARRTGF